VKKIKQIRKRKLLYWCFTWFWDIYDHSTH